MAIVYITGAIRGCQEQIKRCCHENGCTSFTHLYNVHFPSTPRRVSRPRQDVRFVSVGKQNQWRERY